jgi:uncharacterized protein (DUF58 family)
MLDCKPMAKRVNPLVGNVVIFLGVAALVWAAWVGFSALVVLLGLALSAALVTRVWSRLCLKGVTCERRLSQRRVFPGDEVELTLRVANRKILPLPWVEVQDKIPASLAPAAAAGETGSVTLSRSTPLLWYSAASFTEKLNCSARGYYPLGPLSVTSGDIFGLDPRSHEQSDIDHLIVYPRTYALGDLSIPSVSFLGEAKSELKLFDDPSRLLGMREYQPGDNPRRIHWKASARSQSLQVKLYESTTDLKVDVFLAIDTFAERPPEDLELGISATASVARRLLEVGVQTGLHANTKLADTLHPARIAPGSGTDHLVFILEALAKTTAEADEPFVDFFDQERGELGLGGTLVFVVGELSPEIRLLATDLARTGRHVLGFFVGKHGLTSHTTGVRWYRIHQPARAT